MKTAYALLATTIISSVALHGVSISLAQFSDEMTQISGEASETLISLPADFNNLGFFVAEYLDLDFSNSLSDRSPDGAHARMLAEVIANLERHAQELQEDPASWLGDPNPEGSIESFDSGLFRQWARNDPSAALEWVNSSTNVVPEPKSYALIMAALSFGAVFFSRRTLVNRQ